MCEDPVSQLWCGMQSQVAERETEVEHRQRLHSNGSFGMCHSNVAEDSHGRHFISVFQPLAPSLPSSWNLLLSFVSWPVTP